MPIQLSLAHALLLAPLVPILAGHGQVVFQQALGQMQTAISFKLAPANRAVLDLGPALGADEVAAAALVDRRPPGYAYVKLIDSFLAGLIGVLHRQIGHSK